MAVAYSQDLRDRVMAAWERGLKTKQVAALFAVSSSWVRRVMQRKREHGETAPRPRGGVTVVKIDLARLSELVQQQPDATTRELHERLGIDCSVSAVDMALRRLGLSFKKRRSMRQSRIVPTSPSGGSNGVVSSRVRTHAG
jgi:transposase